MDDSATIKSRSFVSVLSLFFQSGYSSALGLIANLVLTILLTPKVFGIYITVLSLISFLNYFSDIGLAASLIQKKEVNDHDVSTTFTVQQILILSFVTIGFLASGFVQNFYKLPIEGVYLYWALLASFLISSLKTIPSVFLERSIKFQKIVLVQVIENTVFYSSVIICAVLGMGLSSFTVSVLLRAVTGLVLIYSLSFWRPRVGISMHSLKTLLSFGLPFQASSFLALFKDDLITLFLSKFLGFEAVGYIGWAKKWAESPVRIIMDNVTRVTFPLIARYQDDKEKIAKIVERNIYYQTAIIAPAIMGLAFVIPQLTYVIPNYHKWIGALPIFYIFCISSFLVTFSAPLINLFNALGKVKLSFSFMLFWTVVMWVLTPFLSTQLGVLGFPITHLIISLTGFTVIWKAQRFIHFKVMHPVYKSVFSTLGMGIVLFALTRVFSTPSYPTIFVLILGGATSYILIMQFIFQFDFKNEVKFFLRSK